MSTSVLVILSRRNLFEHSTVYYFAVTRRKVKKTEILKIKIPKPSNKQKSTSTMTGLSFKTKSITQFSILSCEPLEISPVGSDVESEYSFCDSGSEQVMSSNESSTESDIPYNEFHPNITNGQPRTDPKFIVFWSCLVALLNFVERAVVQQLFSSQFVLVDVFFPS